MSSSETYTETAVEKAAMVPSQRLLLAFMAFLGKIFVYSTRVNLSVAIICMVRDPVQNLTTLTNNINSSSILNMEDTLSGGESACSGGNSDNNSTVYENAEFDWDKTTRGELLAMYFYGYIFTQIPGGWLASRYGGKRVWGYCQAVCALCTLLTPLAARTHVYIAFTLRFLLGFAAGVTFPCVHALLGRWTPPLERSKMASFTFAGPLVGNVLTFSLSGLLCKYGFDNGWGSIFYISGATNLLWVIGWFLLVADTPEKHKHITDRELNYITTAIGKGNVKVVRQVPWLSMALSGPLWAVIVGHFCNNYINYTLLTLLPTFMKESLNFDIQENGVVSALPFVTYFIGSIIVGQIADNIRERKILSTKNVRKIFQVTSLLGSGLCLAVVGQMGCEQRFIAVGLLCLSLALLSANRAGYVSNHLDLAPSYAGVLYGITNTVATIPGMIAPIISGALTPNGTVAEWRLVFYVCAAVALAGALIFLVLADGELQTWAVPPEANLEVMAEVDQSAADDTKALQHSSVHTTNGGDCREKLSLQL